MSSSQAGNSTTHRAVFSEYFAARKLKKGAAGWVLLAGLGVAFVISGDFAGWNFGLERGGFGGMLIATVIVGAMYLCKVLSLAELSSSMPNAGAGYGFARRALGPWGGYITGTAVFLEFLFAPAAIAIFIGACVDSLIGIDGWIVYLVAYVIFVGASLWDAQTAFKLIFAITAVAVVGIGVFVAGMLPHFSTDNLFDIAVNEGALGSSRFLPEGIFGVWAAFPFAMWLFLAVEGVPLAAEEARNPKREVPRGIIIAILILLVFGFLVLVVGPGGAGADFLKNHDAPFVGGLQEVYGESSIVTMVVNWLGLFGLIASFFSIIYAYSRQVFALSRAGYLPRAFSLTSRRGVPIWAVVLPGLLGFALSLTGEGDLMLTMAVLGATVSYALMTLSHLLLRRREPNLQRPFRTPGGAVTSGFALLLSVVAFAATVLASYEAALWSAGAFAVMVGYFVLVSRHRLVANAPEEEF